MRMLLISWLTALGTCVGSFLTVVTWRVPRGESIVSPPSACPQCGTAIRWFDNLPVLSWLVLRGRCRRCRKAIPLRYLAFEVGMGVLFAVVGVVIRPILVPVGLAAVSGFAATIVAWRLRGRFSSNISTASAVIVGVVAGATFALQLNM